MARKKRQLFSVHFRVFRASVVSCSAVAGAPTTYGTTIVSGPVTLFTWQPLGTSTK